jgi:hypothetical protein
MADAEIIELPREIFRHADERYDTRDGERFSR